MRYFFILLFSYFCLSCNAICRPFTICNESRDSVVGCDGYKDSELRWVIKPTKVVQSIVFVFRDFEVESQVKMVIIKEDGSKIFDDYINREKLTNFEIIEKEVKAVMIVKERGGFQLDYFGDCEIIEDQKLTYISQIFDDTNKCWIVNFDVNIDEKLKRIYMIVRDLMLDEKSELKFTDATTHQLLATINNHIDYEVFAFETTINRSIIIDINCQQESCSTTHNQFQLNMYTTNEKGIACIELQTYCSQINDDKLCLLQCPEFNYIIKEEIVLDENAPSIRKGFLTKLNSRINFRKKSGDKRYCPISKQYCGCPNSDDLRRFCRTKKKCFEYGRCTWACILTKMTICLKIRILPIKLL